MKKRLSSKDVAKLAGVSRSTVSRVINNYDNVPKETKEKVLKVIEEYNYHPDISARVLAGKRRRIIGLFFISDSPDRQITGDELTSFMISSVIESASENNYQIIVNILNRNYRKESIKNIKELFYQKWIDAGIFIGAANQEPFIEELISDGFIIGLVDHYLPGKDEINRIVINFESLESSEKAVDYLVGLNHKKIGIINGDLNRYSGPMKYKGFLAGMEKYKLEVRDEWILPGDYTEQSGAEAIRMLLSKKTELPTALFATNDSTAIGAIQELQKNGIEVPGDISIIGHDDHILSTYVKPAITTFRVDFHDMMKKLTSEVIQVVEGNRKDTIRMRQNYAFIERQSCREIS